MNAKEIERRQGLADETMKKPNVETLLRNLVNCEPGALLAARSYLDMLAPTPPIDPTTGRPANYRGVDGAWVTIAEGD